MLPMEKVLKCFCKSRELQNYCTDLLNLDEITEKEQEIILELILDFVKASNQLKHLWRNEE